MRINKDLREKRDSFSLTSVNIYSTILLNCLLNVVLLFWALASTWTVTLLPLFSTLIPKFLLMQGVEGMRLC